MILSDVSAMTRLPFPNITPLLRRLVALAGPGLALWSGSVCGDVSLPPAALLKVRPVVELQAQPIPLTEVRLLDGSFRHAQDLDRQYLLSLDPDRLLYTYRLNAGLPTTAAPLSGWEEPKGELRGHFAGHYLSACALMYASTGDERLKQRAEAVVRGLAECQTRIGTGYLSAFPEEFFDRVEKRQRVWAPYYTLHKILAGLLDAYVYCGDPQALAVCQKLADWVIARNSRLSDEQMQFMLGEEHGGMNEVLANLYALTGERKYLDIAQRFNHQAVIGPAEQRVDKLTGLHANTQIPKFIGTAREYELTGDEKLKTASEFFWSTVALERSYAIGGHSDGEHFSPKERLSNAFGPSTTETCNTYNMLKLTRHLFAWEPRAGYADFYERALLNHILASQDPVTGGMCYYVPLRPGSKKTYGGDLDAFWCCTGTGVENHAKYGDSIYFHRGPRELFVNLFIASQLNWKEAGVTLRQETSFPENGRSRLLLNCARPTEFTLKIRHPSWATTGFTVRINGGQPEPAGQPGSFVAITRTWKSGDTIEIEMPFTLRTEGFRDNPRRYAFLNGPLVLSAAVDPRRPFPAVVAGRGEALLSLQPVAGRPNTFTAPASVFRIGDDSSGANFTLEPFYQMHGGRNYLVYFDEFTPDEWQARQLAYRAERARLKELEARTVDVVFPGEAQSERDHSVKGGRSSAGDFGDRKYRHATDGGWFSWDLKIQPSQQLDLLVTYWGSDSGNRTFDILVDGVRLATVSLRPEKPGQFRDVTYPLPKDLTRDKTRITVRFAAHAGQFAGGVFGCRVVRR